MATLVERRRFMQALAAASAAPAAAAAQAPAAAAPEEATQVSVTLHDIGGATVPSYFHERQLATLARLSDLFMPPMDGKPGALEAEVPQFLDFHVSQSPEQRRNVYRAGLDTLHSVSLAQFGRTFAELSDAEADKLVAEPLTPPWTPSLPADPLAAFLREAKIDILNATVNSYAYAAAPDAAGGRSRLRTSSLYWYTIE